jgi:hypothetical protein
MAEQPIIRVFVSSTWLDLKPERAAVEVLLEKFRETKFIGMEHFGSRDETTRGASLDEVNRAELYLGIIGGRYGSGITEAEYDRAHDRNRPCLIYFKEDAAIPPEGRDDEPGRAVSLARFKEKLRDGASGHTVTEFSGPHELASRIAGDLHNWLFDRYLGPALEGAAKGALDETQAAALGGDLRRLAALNRDLSAQVAEERRRLDEQRRVALEAFYRLTYVVPNTLERYPDTAREREALVRDNLKQLDRLYTLSSGAHDILRELATNQRLLATILLEQGKPKPALAAFGKSADYCAALIRLQPGNALYHRDRAVSHLNAGMLLEQKGDLEAARAHYEAGSQSARRAAELDTEWSELARDAVGRVQRLQHP